MEILIIFSIIILAVVGLLGGVLPVLPGPPISFAALLLMWIVGGYDVSATQLWVTGILMLLLTVLDYVAPIILTKIGGGTKAGVKGATVGLFLGLFLPNFYQKRPLFALMLLINGALNMIPVYLHQGNRDARSMTNLDGILVGIADKISQLQYRLKYHPSSS